MKTSLFDTILRMGIRRGCRDAFLVLLCLLATSIQARDQAEKVFTTSDGIASPKLKHKTEPRYSEEARRALVQGTVLLQIVVDDQGLPRNIEVLSPVGFGLDEKAINAVSTWRFIPGTKDGRPVRVRATVEVSFRLIGQKFDQKAEIRRTAFNQIVSRLKTKDGKPSDKDVEIMRDLANHKYAGANYVLGLWEMDGQSGTKDPVAGMAHMQNAADHDYGPAMYYIGRAQMTGTSLPKNEQAGLSLMQQAAVLGSREAQFKLGIMYETSEGVEKDLSRARRYFRLCAAGGTPECQYRLGKLLLNEEEVNEAHHEQAIAWMMLADQHGLAAAHEVAANESARLTPEERTAVDRFRSSLEQKK